MPGPKICSNLQACEVEEGEDAHFSIELSVAMIGTWFLNSAQLQHGGQYSIRQTQTLHSLVIRETRTTDDTAEVTFIANGVRDSAVLRVKRRCKTGSFWYINHAVALSASSLILCVYFFAAAVVKFVPLSELDKNKKLHTGDAVVLYCEVSHAFEKVSWFKDGKELQVTDGLNIQSDGNMRRIVIQSADVSHSGVYTCKGSGDVIEFSVDVAGKVSKKAHLFYFSQNWRNEHN